MLQMGMRVFDVVVVVVEEEKDDVAAVVEMSFVSYELADDEDEDFVHHSWQHDVDEDCDATEQTESLQMPERMTRMEGILD